jgi:hypothetical protein
MYQVKPYRMPIDVENMVVALMYYIQEFARIGQPIPKPQVLEGVDEEQLVTRPYQKVDLLLAREHAAIRKRFCEASAFWRERYHPGKFIANVGQFGVWEEKLVKLLSGIPGSSCVPLSYVIQSQSIIKLLNAESHMDSLIIVAPHSGTYYSNDTAEYVLAMSHVTEMDAYYTCQYRGKKCHSDAKYIYVTSDPRSESKK